MSTLDTTPNYELLRGRRQLLRSVLRDLIGAVGTIEAESHEEQLRLDVLRRDATRLVQAIESEVLHEVVDARFAHIDKLPTLDLVLHLYRQAAFSARTFGPGQRLQGVVDHIRKELIEVEDSGGALVEWIDVAILAFDGALRSGATPERIARALVDKQTKNEGRTWPDWRTADATKAIEHDRTGERA